MATPSRSTRPPRGTNETKGKSYDPLPLTPKEEEIRRSGGIFAVGRREFRRSVETPPEIAWPDPETARRLTTTEQIVWAHRVDKDAIVAPGATLRVYADLLPASDGGAIPIHTFNQITGGKAIFPRQAAIANDHFVFTGKESDDRQTAIGRELARIHGMEKPYYATPGDGIFHFYFPEQGLVLPGQFIPGADSHSRAYGAYGAVGFGVGSTTLGFGWSTGYIFFTVAKQRRVVFRRAPAVVSGKDIVLELLRAGERSSRRDVGRVRRRGTQLPMSYRNTIANMMAEGEALNGIFAQDEVTDAWYRAKGIEPGDLPYPRVSPGRDASYELDETIELDAVQPMIAKPYSPGNAYPAEDVARERLTFDKALIGSCTNGSYERLYVSAASSPSRADSGSGFAKSRKSLACLSGVGRSGGTRSRRPTAPRRGSDLGTC